MKHSTRIKLKWQMAHPNIKVELVRLVLVVLLSCSVTLSFAKGRSSSKIEPRWLDELPTPSNNTFSYQVVTASASSSSMAIQSAIKNLFASENMKGGVYISSNSVSSENVAQRFVDGKLSEVIDYSSQTSINSRTDEQLLYVMEVDSYWEQQANGQYTAMTLVAKSNGSVKPNFDTVEVTSMYGGRGLWRSAIVPGWGQIYKGSTLKGSLMLGGVAASAVAAIYSNTLADDYYSKMAHTYDVNAIRTYKTKGDQFASARNICIGVAGALYLYNLIDAIAAPGARRVVVKRKNSFAQNLSFSPSVMMDGSVGMMAGLNF